MHIKKEQIEEWAEKENFQEEEQAEKDLLIEFFLNVIYQSIKVVENIEDYQFSDGYKFGKKNCFYQNKSKPKFKEKKQMEFIKVTFLPIIVYLSIIYLYYGN